MPAYSFGGRNLPATIRAARALLFLEAGILVLAGAFAVIIALFLGAGNAIPFAGTTLSGVGAAALGVAYGALGLVALYFGIELGRLTGWSRNAVVGLQAALIVLFMARGDFSASLVLSVAVCIAVSVLVVTSSASAALNAAAPRRSADTAAQSPQH